LVAASTLASAVVMVLRGSVQTPPLGLMTSMARSKPGGSRLNFVDLPCLWMYSELSMMAILTAQVISLPKPESSRGAE